MHSVFNFDTIKVLYFKYKCKKCKLMRVRWRVPGDCVTMFDGKKALCEGVFTVMTVIKFLAYI